MAADKKEVKNGYCRQCGKRIDSESHAGSLTGYLFQNLYCNCGKAPAKDTPKPQKEGDNKDFCPKCGLRLSEVRAGSMTGFLFQDIRCKCPPDESFKPGVMAERLARLKESDGGHTFSPEEREEPPKPANKAKARPHVKMTTNRIGLTKGAIIGGAYRVIKQIGRGGMGEVYLAEHLSLNKKCALKVIPPDQVTQNGWLRFQTEAKAIAKLDHPNLVKVSDLGVHEECLPFYAMEYVEGRTMWDLLSEQGPMPLKTALPIFEQLCDGLDYAHHNGIIHRDVKPANIMLSKKADGKITAKLLDFGLAKLSQHNRYQQSLTSVGDIMGSPLYMSPEQCEGGKIDRRTDIYSLGVTLFQCLIGSTPFESDVPIDLVEMHLRKQAPSLESFVGAGVFPDSLEVVMAKLLRKNPVERYQTMSELRGDLERVANGESVLPFYMSRSSYPGAGSKDQRGKRAAEKANARLKAEEATPPVQPQRKLNVRNAIILALSLVTIGLLAVSAWSAFSIVGRQPVTKSKNETNETGTKAPARQDYTEVGNNTAVEPNYDHLTTDAARQKAASSIGLDAAPLTVPASAQETKPFSTIVEINHKKQRRFDFPLDVDIGKIRVYGLPWVPAMGVRTFPVDSYLEFTPKPVVVDYPGYVTRFKDGDIQSIQIANHLYKDSMIQVCTMIPGVRCLKLGNTPFLREKDSKYIEKFANLKGLVADADSLTPEVLAKLTVLPKLEFLSLEHFHKPEAIFEALKGANNLKALYIKDIAISKSDMQIIVSRPNLTSLILEAPICKSGEYFDTLKQMPKLSQLTLYEWTASPANMEVIKSLKHLKVLNLCKIWSLKHKEGTMQAEFPRVKVNLYADRMPDLVKMPEGVLLDK